MRTGGVLAYPTESVYGLGCDPLNGAAVARILDMKHRPVDKGLILIAARFEQLQPYLGPMERSRLDRMRDSWPGPVTWLAPAAAWVPRWLRGTHTDIALRVTAHPLAAAVCRMLDAPLVSTSANLRGRPPARTALGVRRVFHGQIDCLLNGPCGPLSRPTIIRDSRDGSVIRPA